MIQTILLAMAGLPEFVIGVLLIALFSTTVFHIFPAVTISSPTGGHPWDNPKVMVLPTLTLVLWVAPYVSRIVRAIAARGASTATTSSWPASRASPRRS